MKVFLIDETSRQKTGTKGHSYFVLCGLILNADHLIKLAAELEVIAEYYKIQTLKGSRTSKFTASKKLEMTEKIFSSLSKYEVEARAIYLSEKTVRAADKYIDTYLGALDFLIERFFLSLKSEDGPGLIIMDSLNPKTEADLRKIFYTHIKNTSQSWVMSDKKHPYKDKICTWLLFSDDETNPMLQATDLIAASLNSAIWSCQGDKFVDVEKLPEKNDYLKIYWPLFAKSNMGKVSGWGVKIWD